MKKSNHILTVLLIAAAVVTTACNSKDADQEPTSTSASTQVTAFALKDDSKVATNLSKVHFTIDLDKREIYNADSLPVGTDVSALLATITYPTMTSVVIDIAGGSKAGTATINYGSNSNDSIDFTGNVSLTLTSQDGAHKATYSVKVNVHKMEPDSLFWPEGARRDLPIADAVKQRTVKQADKYVMLGATASGYSVATTTDLPAENWTVKAATVSFEADLNSLTASPERLFMLATDGSLYESADGTAWDACDCKLFSLLGCYDGNLLAVTTTDGSYHYAHRPIAGGSLTTDEPVADGFPIAGFSVPVEYTSELSLTPLLLLHGGVLADGSLSGDTWAYDGESWTKITEDKWSAPKVKGALLLPYYTFATGTSWEVTEYPTLLTIGGIGADGQPTKAVYMSRDNGVHWQKASSLMQLPAYIPASGFAQAYVAWQSMSASWQVPYIYVFGGVTAEGWLYNNIWKGAVNRLTFVPII